MKNIIACVDFSKTTSAVVETAAALATTLRTKLYLLTAVVIENGIGYESMVFTGETHAQKTHKARTKLNELREPLLEHGLDVATILIEGSASSVRAIVDESKRIDAGLIVIGSQGHGLLHRIFVGSTARGVLHQTACSVVLVPGRSFDEGCGGSLRRIEAGTRALATMRNR
ncbi:MAG: universal stress protein [Planctomycetes bacterium]|nr:universal stress protein [Planctomycetota bacterium]